MHQFEQFVCDFKLMRIGVDRGTSFGKQTRKINEVNYYFGKF